MHSLKPEKPWQTKLSSAGLVYFHFGTQILATRLGLNEEDPVVHVLYDKVPVCVQPQKCLSSGQK